ncbi:uncharacterized protein LOC132273687 [Cornus florida]|uniref:uncharacterized protein LOC132273687 n=1 Tax=Cornus florida TaxID=4283 RepID=UPI00289CD50A|nr:uncharacterized protein LOC132273687 [Cornus florida]
MASKKKKKGSYGITHFILALFFLSLSSTFHLLQNSWMSWSKIRLCSCNTITGNNSISVKRHVTGEFGKKYVHADFDDCCLFVMVLLLLASLLWVVQERLLTSMILLGLYISATPEGSVERNPS